MAPRVWSKENNKEKKCRKTSQSKRRSMEECEREKSVRLMMRKVSNFCMSANFHAGIQKCKVLVAKLHLSAGIHCHYRRAPGHGVIIDIQAIIIPSTIKSFNFNATSIQFHEYSQPSLHFSLMKK